MALRVVLVTVLCVMVAASVKADDDLLRSELYKIGAEDSDTRKTAVATLLLKRDSRIAEFLRHFQDGTLYVLNEEVYLCPNLQRGADGKRTAALLDPLTGEPVTTAGVQLVVSESELRNISPVRRERRTIRDAIVALELYSPNVALRTAAAKSCGDLGLPMFLGPLKDLAKTETVTTIRELARESELLIRFRADDAKDRLEAARELGNLRSSRALPLLSAHLAKIADQHGEEQIIYEGAIAEIESYQSWVRGFDHLFGGISLGSILILMALGLSITFGLMGVINMAHGELMMIGAYATYEVQNIFVSHLPATAFDWYYIIALPAAFVCAAFAGFLIEILVVRHLYGRPLETLLATWGVGLVLIQFVRLIYGDNIGVNSPTWLRGGAEVVQDLVLPYNRCFVILLCGLCVFLTYTLLRRTTLGLMVRATTQNRQTASSLGVNTRRVDSCTFAFGAGLAGIAGCALTLIGGVTPDMGQNYIVDSFLVVVTGGVGELLGVLTAGLGMGLLTKTLEPFVESVWAKVLILACVILFIQWRPAGLFPPKGRLADV